ncbi:hypothetical protein MAM1_0186d07538 [Mucor ambiguus]|uniref:Uncharacterized protein n=1 Tax=Mucor ambiguus TaxID=91626 RepID=A0A0C9MWT5_9FUNG|nr:hypothetical protein MAM1_0186d07538 [Mucor ambiguus]
MNDKPKLPSIKDLLEGGPGLIGTVAITQNYTRPPAKQQHHHHHQYHHKHPSSSVHHVHRRHASEHIISNKDRLLPPHPPHQPQHPPPLLPPPPSSHRDASLQMPPSITKSSTMSLPMDMQQLSLEKKKPPETRRGRTHSRSYSDFIYPTNTKHTMLKEAQESAADQRARVQNNLPDEQEEDAEEENEYEEEEETTQVNISRSNSSS